MNQKNYAYLKDQIKYSGFGEGLDEELRTAIESGKTDFKLKHYTKYEEDKLETKLSFSKSKQTDMYFFNSYRVSLQKESSPDNLEQSFYMNPGNNITLKEAYNLMSGRAVNKDLTNKEGELFNAWIQMDFKQSNESGNFKLKYYHQNYGFELEKALSKHPIRELSNDEFKEKLMESLKKGNLQSVTFQTDGGNVKHFIEANPQFKTINVYDLNKLRLDNRQAQTNKAGKSIGKGKKEEPGSDGDGPGGLKERKSKRRGMAV